MNDSFFDLTFHLIVGIAGLTVLFLVGRYVLACIKKGGKFTPLTKEEHLVEFEKMLYKGAMNRTEFRQVKRNLAHEIVEKTKLDTLRKQIELQEAASTTIEADQDMFQEVEDAAIEDDQDQPEKEKVIIHKFTH